jgi:hypothetical protein
LDGPHAFFPTCSSHEAERLDALRKLNLLDTPPSEAFDRITRMAAQLFQLPVAAVSLTDSDRQWFKSRVGVEHSTIPRMKAPCAQAADEGQMLVITDLQADDHYRDSPLAASGVRFYAGAPLMTNDGYCLGAMCLLGAEPRQVSEAERAALQDMAAMVMAQIELRHAFGRVDPLSGLPNRNQFIDDFGDLALEITESALMKNPRLAEATLNALAAAGVHLAIDDFGTGYSSLAYLQRLPAEVVKIDQSFVRGLDRDERKRALVSAMIKLSHDLGHRVVAEGVETPEVAQVLKDAGCDEAQGYWYARPLGPQAFAAWLMDQRRGQAALAA